LERYERAAAEPILDVTSLSLVSCYKRFKDLPATY